MLLVENFTDSAFFRSCFRSLLHFLFLKGIKFRYHSSVVHECLTRLLLSSCCLFSQYLMNQPKNILTRSGTRTEQILKKPSEIPNNYWLKVWLFANKILQTAKSLLSISTFKCSTSTLTVTSFAVCNKWEVILTVITSSDFPCLF